MPELHDTKVFSLIDGFVRRGSLYPHEAEVLKTALQQVPADFCAGRWSENRLTWLGAEIVEMFGGGVENFRPLGERLAAIKRGFSVGDWKLVDAQMTNLYRILREKTKDPRMWHRGYFLGVVLALCLVARGRPVIAVFGEKNKRRSRQTYMERLNAPSTHLRLVS